MQERVHTQQSSGLQLGQSVLYFGCRRSDQDYLYAPQLEQWSREGILTLFTAFSRQQVCTSLCSGSQHKLWAYLKLHC